MSDYIDLRQDLYPLNAWELMEASFQKANMKAQECHRLLFEAEAWCDVAYNKLMTAANMCRGIRGEEH